VHHHTIQINQQADATIFQFIILTFIYSSTCFRHPPAHHQGLSDCSSSLWFYLCIVVIAVLCSWSGRLARPHTQRGYHHDMKVKPEAATAVIEPLMMGGRTPKTCWAAGPTTNTAWLSPRYEGKTRGCYCSHWAPDDGRENARNMLSCRPDHEHSMAIATIWR